MIQNLPNSNFSENSAAVGGAIYSVNGALQIPKLIYSLKQNISEVTGGVILSHSSILTNENSTFTRNMGRGNRVSVCLSTLYVRNSVFAGVIFQLEGHVILSNSSSSWRGNCFS